MDQQQIPDWQQIDTIFLDMDGTLLDLYFDNHFWLEHLPMRFAEEASIDIEAARAHLSELYQSRQGTLDWYCIDYWGDKLGLDILTLKEEVDHLIRMHPHVEEFLHKLRASGKTVALVTNAHPGTLAFKLERIPMADYFTHLVSSHEFGHPKESQQFWESLQKHLPFERERTLFIDDSEAVLRSAREYGIGHLVAISQPDSQLPGQALEDFISISNFSELHKPS
ncbi:GMP/IMP nucleotidase [Solemya velum gill symbiont]|uniref:Haloacid dehalogenase n=1 Tax=Solemya velum gill symbiont TaxID=2340 RepID=A0A0B0H5I3_SOVGS|nr:GMP/IMP nucleotidase [Solemya velum gill symbiont]KHF24350.1 haloacid dehalogenase [Solemya velum gill symbiont]OOY35220.1 haloacid dehalogenase [Solemya velum gill symbiont]OOY37921.1 haloacid dehalogenase [Solemya velum gill symbiont]OOY48150.1 haloacid dehalogenase [Solemya velum gill symbiont]OOY48273.1 haloacid dehalogenase [Solemya velum gill symbiont]